MRVNREKKYEEKNKNKKNQGCRPKSGQTNRHAKSDCPGTQHGKKKKKLSSERCAFDNKHALVDENSCEVIEKTRENPKKDRRETSLVFFKEKEGENSAGSIKDTCGNKAGFIFFSLFIFFSFFFFY